MKEKEIPSSVRYKNPTSLHFHFMKQVMSFCIKLNVCFFHQPASKISRRTRKLSTQNVKVKEKQPKTLTVTTADEDKNKARYYEQTPDSQPVVSIIPRRIPPQVQEKDEVDEKQKVATSQEQNSSDDALLKEKTKNELQRTRLMDKVYRLQERVKPKKSTAPQFLPLK